MQNDIFVEERKLVETSYCAVMLSFIGCIYIEDTYKINININININVDN